MTDLASEATAPSRIDESNHAGARGRRFAPSPLLVAAVAVAACIGLLLLPLTLPIGPMYWDLVVYFDGAQRVLDGQIPSVDFFAPVGPLGYWLFALGETLFPKGQPLLVVHWMFLAVTLPPFLPVLTGVDKRSRGLALALLLPFLVFQLLPMNVEQYSTYPSIDGYGIYNRQVTEVLYVLTAALLFERRQRVLVFVIAWCCIAVFLSKITGFAAAGLLCAFAFLAGRVRLESALASVGAFLAVLGMLELSLGLVSAYLGDILTLVSMNEGVLLSRFLQAASIHFGIFGSGAILILALLVVDKRAILAELGAGLRRPTLAGVTRLFDRNVFWLAAALVTGLFFETQNTGGQAFIFLWPVLLSVLASAHRLSARASVCVLVLVAATAMPPLVNVLHRTARAVIGQVLYVSLPATNLKQLGAVTQRSEVVERAAKMIANYARFPQPYQALADQGELPTFTLYADLDFQVAWLLTADEAVTVIRDYEGRTGLRFQTIMNLNFANPFPYLMDRQAPKRIAIGADPSRAVPPPDAATLAAVAATDLVLYPTCPLTAADIRLREIYAPALGNHREVRLSRCWIGLIREGLNPPA